MKKISFLLLIASVTVAFWHSCTPQRLVMLSENTSKDSINYHNTEKALHLEVQSGKAFNHPSFSIWIEDMEGKLLHTLFVTKSVATGMYQHGQLTDSTWSNKPGSATRPAALPYWIHKKGELKNGKLLPNPETPYTDAVTGATPKSNFVLLLNQPKNLPKYFRLLCEINQTWDWNEYWTNSKFPNDKNYKSSAQPSVIYACDVQLDNDRVYYLNPIGHGHPSGKNGKLYTNLNTLSSALQITRHIKATFQ